MQPSIGSSHEMASRRELGGRFRFLIPLSLRGPLMAQLLLGTTETGRLGTELGLHTTRSTNGVDGGKGKGMTRQRRRI